jgi:hypothetical protein
VNFDAFDGMAIRRDSTLVVGFARFPEACAFELAGFSFAKGTDLFFAGSAFDGFPALAATREDCFFDATFAGFVFNRMDLAVFEAFLIALDLVFGLVAM